MELAKYICEKDGEKAMHWAKTNNEWLCFCKSIYGWFEWATNYLPPLNFKKFLQFTLFYKGHRIMNFIFTHIFVKKNHATFSLGAKSLKREGGQLIEISF